MTNLQPIIDDLLHLQDKLAQLPFPHPWDNHVAKNSVARIDALVSDLRVVACRMGDDEPSPVSDDALIQWITESSPEPAPQPITESLMRAAQVGWVVRTVGGKQGTVECVGVNGLFIDYGSGEELFYYHHRCGQYSYRDCDIVSLAPPAVVEGVAEVIAT